MEAKYIVECLAFVAAFFAAVCFTFEGIGSIREGRFSRQACRGALRHESIGTSLVRNGIGIGKPCAEFLLKNTYVASLFSEIVNLLTLKGFTTTSKNCCSLYCSAAAILFLLATLLASSPFVGMLAVGFGVGGTFVFVKQCKETQKNALREVVPDALRSMSVCSHAGLSLHQTFQQVAQEIKEPLKTLFQGAVNDIETGKTISETLETFRHNAIVSELIFVAVALDVQHKTGGSLQKVLDAACDSVESELELKRTLKVQTAQAKLSARIVSAMPVILILVFSFLSPGFLDPFFSSIEGVALLGLAVCMQVVGIAIVRRILTTGAER